VKVVVPEPTFTLYRQVVQIFGGEVISVPLKQDFTFDVDAIGAAARTSGASVLILCSPNNPTGSRITDAELVLLAKDLDGIVVVDEAYHEFSGGTVVPLLSELPNLIVLRTFSKAMAMAGLRVGYMIASPELTREVQKATLPYNVNFLSATVARIACQRFELLKPHIELIISERDRLLKAVARIPGLTPVPTSSNFFLVRTAMDPKVLFERLLEHDVLVRDVSKYPMLSDYTRVSVGRPEENDIIIKALTEVMTGA
ncbi:MAG TPA: aminotransferase class I/II-fold pyridoxal phosphate-dependent enzyme, partial [Blastocatellia bacterium]|nr:aminotransferase class I/II-fold pyridoxal phosphate-dependent enzyme [Blastocatellia bacterium]